MPSLLASNENSKYLRSSCNSSHLQGIWWITKLFVVRFPRVEMGTEISGDFWWDLASDSYLTFKCKMQGMQRWETETGVAGGALLGGPSVALSGTGPSCTAIAWSSVAFTPQDTLLTLPALLLPHHPGASCSPCNFSPAQQSTNQLQCPIPVSRHLLNLNPGR